MDLATSYADGMLCVTAQALNALVSPVAVSYFRRAERLFIAKMQLASTSSPPKCLISGQTKGAYFLNKLDFKT